jgi:hypothetical protein
MKSFLLSLLLLMSCAAAAAAQAPAGNSYRLGDRDVSIPPPGGFVEAASRSEAIRKLFEVTESPALDLLAVHIPSDVMEQVARGEHRDFEFYTKVSVSKGFREKDFSREDLAGLVAILRANASKLFDFNRPEMQKQFKHQDKGLTDLLKTDSKLDLSQPVNLGEIDSTPDSYGMLMLMKVKFQSGSYQKEGLLVGGASAVRVKNRLVWIYTYRKFDSEKDADVLRAFTKQWLAEILRANP